MADPTTCPVAALARETRQITAALDRNEDARKGLQPHALIPLEYENRLLEDRRTAVEETAALRRAASPEGALFQVALLVDAAEVVNSYTQDRYSGEVEAAMSRVRGLAYSIAAFVEREAGLRGEDVFGDWYMGLHLDPHATVEKALATSG